MIVYNYKVSIKIVRMCIDILCNSILHLSLFIYLENNVF